jgi:hypothetical protein
MHFFSYYHSVHTTAWILLHPQHKGGMM